GTYRDIVQTNLLTAGEYAQSANESLSEVNERIEVAKVICEFLDYLQLPEQYHVAREYQVYSLFREMMAPMKKLNDLEKTQLKHIAFTNTMMNAIQDQRRFIRDIKKLIRDEADRKSTRLNSSHVSISYAVFCLKKKTREGEN